MVHKAHHSFGYRGADAGWEPSCTLHDQTIYVECHGHGFQAQEIIGLEGKGHTHRYASVC